MAPEAVAIAAAVLALIMGTMNAFRYSSFLKPGPDDIGETNYRSLLREIAALNQRVAVLEAENARLRAELDGYKGAHSTGRR